MNKNYKIILKVSLIWVVLIVVGFIIAQEKPEKDYGLRIDKNYIKVIGPCQREVNDIYLTHMILFSDKCNALGGNQSFYRIADNQNRLYGVALWCQNLIPSFTFYFSDKWRKEQHEKK